MAESALQNIAAGPYAMRVLGALPAVLNLLLVAMLGYGLALCILRFMPAPGGPSPLQQDAQTSVQQRTPAIDYGVRIAGQHLFGEPGEEQTIATQTIEKTQLNLKLLGVLTHMPPEQALAIVSSDGRQEIVYGIGDELPGSAELKEVHTDYVIIQYQGRYEKLELLERENVNLTPGKPSAPRSSPPVTPVTITPERATQIRNDLLADPKKVLDTVALNMEHKDGELIGYKMEFRDDPRLLHELGFQDGDVVVSVNGISVTDQRALQALSSAGRYDVTVLRGGVETALSIRFK